MNRMEMILENASTMECALKTLGYAMEFTNYIDHNEEQLREITTNIAGSIECLQDYLSEITDAISNEIYFRKHPMEDDEEHVDAPDRADEADGLDYEKVVNAALDTDKARATISCIIAALHDKGGDSTDIKLDGMSCWQVRASLESVYDILTKTALIFFRASEMIEELVGRKESAEDEENHGQE